jgi:cytochrome P450
VLRAFTSRRIAALGPEIEALCIALIDAMPSGEFDLLPAFAQKLPVIVIARLLGVPEVMAPEGGAPVTETPTEPTPEQEAALRDGAMMFKGLLDKREPEEWEIKAEQTVDRWTEILDRSLERLFERQQRVVIEKASGAKARKALTTRDLDVDMIFDKVTWDKQLEEDLRPVLAGIVTEAAESSWEDGVPDGEEPISQKDLQQYLDEQMQRVKKSNETTREEILAAILVVMLLSGNEDRSSILRTALGAIFAELMGRRRRLIAEQESQTAYNAGVYLAAARAARAEREQGEAEGRPEDQRRVFMKRWVTQRDAKVRSQHRTLEGKRVPFADGFKVEGYSLRFPGDPLAPAHLTINCRCKLRWL